jgi:hypothetical protein
MTKEETMKPLDCVGIQSGPNQIGKHDFQLNPAIEAVRRVGFRPQPQTTLTPKQHLLIVQNLVNRALTNGAMSRQEALRCKECLEEVAKALCGVVA